MQRSKTLRLIGAAAALALFATACSGDGGDEGDNGDTGDTGTETEADGGDGTEAQPTGGSFSTYVCEPASLIPQNSNETCGSAVVATLFGFLVEYNDETVEAEWGDEIPNAHAASIETEDNQTWTITLKDGWTFHNGDPVTAQSYVDAWNFGAYGPNAQNNNYFFDIIEGYEDLNPSPPEGETEAPEPETEELSGLEVVDETTFEVTLNSTYANFPSRLGYNPFAAIPEAAIEDPEAFNEEPVGNGQYQMDGAWEHDQGISVTRYEDFGGEQPGNADSIEFQIYADPGTAFTDLQADQLDVMDTLPTEQIGQAEEQFGDRYFERPSSSFTYIGFPLYDEQFADNPELRQAFSMAIDREGIIGAVFDGAFTPADAYVSPVVDGYREGACGGICEFDPDAAAELLEEAGGWEGTLTLWYNSDGDHQQWMEAVAGQLRDNLGIEDIQFESLLFSEYLELNDNQEFTGPFRLGWIMDYPSAENYLAPLYGCNGSSNGTGYCNEEFDELIEEGNSADSAEEAVEAYNAAEDIVIEDAPIIPMWFGLSMGVHSETVSNVEFDPYGFVKLADVEVNE